MCKRSTEKAAGHRHPPESTKPSHRDPSHVRQDGWARAHRDRHPQGAWGLPTARGQGAGSLWRTLDLSASAPAMWNKGPRDPESPPQVPTERTGNPPTGWCVSVRAPETEPTQAYVVRQDRVHRSTAPTLQAPRATGPDMLPHRRSLDALCRVEEAGLIGHTTDCPSREMSRMGRSKEGGHAPGSWAQEDGRVRGFSLRAQRCARLSGMVVHIHGNMDGMSWAVQSTGAHWACALSSRKPK